jgi:hypothetical protein
MRFLTTPARNLCKVVRNDKGLYIKGKRGRAALNPVLITSYIAALPRFPDPLKTLSF